MAVGVHARVDPSAIGPSVRPQDDFFRFVNGGGIRRPHMPADRISVGQPMPGPGDFRT